MKMNRGCMKNEKNIFFIIAIAFCIILSANIYNSVQSYRYRRLCVEYRTELYTATNENRELRKTIEECQNITGSIGELCNRNISSSRQIIELIEQIRTQVYELENSLGGFDQSKYYNYWDNEFGISQ